MSTEIKSHTELSSDSANQIENPYILLPDEPDPDQIATTYGDDPEAFLYDILGIRGLFPKACEFIDAVRTSRKVVVRGSYGTAKTFLSAGLTIWRIYRRPNAKVITTAPRDRQVRDLLWAEINTLWLNARMKLGGRCNATSIYPHSAFPKWFGLGMTANQNNEAAMQGYHGDEVTFIGDEASGLRPSTFEIADRLCVGENDKQWFIGNAIDPISYFAGLFKDPTFAKIVITAFDTPNVRAQKTIIPGMVTWDWVLDKAKKWGKNSQLYKSRVLAQFPTSSDDSIIPLHYIESSMDRWEARIEQLRSTSLSLTVEEAAELIAEEYEGIRALGADFAGGGKDETIKFKRRGNWGIGFESFVGNTQAIAGSLAIDHAQGFELAGDAIGIGTGVIDPLEDAGIPITKVIGSERSDRKDATGTYGFTNKRTELHWAMREALNPDNPDQLLLPRNDMALEDLATPTFKYVVGGRIQMEPKEQLKARLGRSPDRGDAAVNSLAVEGQTPAIIQGDSTSEPRSRDREQNSRRQPHERQRRW